MSLALAVTLLLAPLVRGQQQGSENAGAALQRGVQAIEAGRIERAISELERAVQLQPSSVEAHYHLGRALFIAERAAEALPHLEEALRLIEDGGPVQFLLAQVYLQLGRFEDAGVALDAAAASRPGYPPISYYRAELCYRLGKLEKARDLLEDVINAAPEWNLPLVRAGTVAMDLGDPQSAVLWFRVALDLDPEGSNARLWMRLASAYAASNQVEDAIEGYRQAVAARPRLLPPRVALITQLSRLQKHDELLEVIDDLLAIHPDNPLAHYQRAQVLSLRGETEAALADVEIAIRGFDQQAAELSAPAEASEDEDPASGRHTYLTLAKGLRMQLLQKAGRDDEAEAVARDLVESAPWYPEAHFVLGTLMLRNRDSAGRQQMEIFKQLSDAREHRDLGDYYIEQVADLGRAAAEYEAALASWAEDNASRIRLAKIKRLQGQPTAALELLGAADPEGVEEKEWFEEMILSLHAIGNQQEAQEYWRQARAAGHVYGPDVWAAMREDIPGC
jgi:tetratricopeptide (TPR) repeat protein